MTILFKLFQKGISSFPSVIFEQYSQLKISEKSFVLLLYLMDALIKKEEEDLLEDITQQFNWNETTVQNCLAELIERKFITIELRQNQKGKKSEFISVEPFFEFLDQLLVDQLKPDEIVDKNESSPAASDSKRSLIQLFESEFGRSLTQIELNTLISWQTEHKFSPDLISVALKQAVLNGAFSLRYIESILLKWQKQNIRTPEQAQRAIQLFNESKLDSMYKEQHATDSFELPKIDWNHIRKN